MIDVDKVWLLFSGAYSGRGVIGAFTTQQAAQATLAALVEPYDPHNPNHNHDDYDIEECDVDRVAWKVRQWADVHVVDGVPGEPAGYGHMDSWDIPMVERWGWWAPKEKGGPRRPICTLSVSGDTRDAARKAAAEQAFRLAAEWDMRVQAAKEARPAPRISPVRYRR